MNRRGVGVSGGEEVEQRVAAGILGNTFRLVAQIIKIFPFAGFVAEGRTTRATEESSLGKVVGFIFARISRLIRQNADSAVLNIAMNRSESGKVYENVDYHLSGSDRLSSPSKALALRSRMPIFGQRQRKG